MTVRHFAMPLLDAGAHGTAAVLCRVIQEFLRMSAHDNQRERSRVVTSHAFRDSLHAIIIPGIYVLFINQFRECI